MLEAQRLSFGGASVQPGRQNLSGCHQRCICALDSAQLGRNALVCRASAHRAAEKSCGTSTSTSPQQADHFLGRPLYDERKLLSLCPSATSTSRATVKPSTRREAAQEIETASTHSERRTRRLEILIALRKLYRNLLRAQGLLAQPSPIYFSDTYGPGKRQALSSLDLDEEEIDKRDAAIEIIAELQLTAEQLKADLRSLQAVYGSFGDVFESDTKQHEEQVAKVVAEAATKTADRAQKELKLLPFRTPREAQAALDARNLKYKTVAARLAQKRNRTESTEADSRELSDRLEAAEKAVEKFVARRIQPAVQKAVKTPVSRWADGVRTGAGYVKGVWVRLNGGGRRMDVISGLPDGIQLPTSNKDSRAAATRSLSLEISNLEKQLQEASKAREQRLRKAGMSERARMAGQLRDMDDEVLTLSRTLAVNTLQLEMEYIFAALEDEALDVVQGTKDAGFLLSRTGSSDEVALLIAEFGLLDSELASLSEAVHEGHAARLDDGNLARLAVDIPDLRSRLGIGEAMVFSGSGWTVVKLQAAVAESWEKVKEGSMFFSRGIRLLGSDMSSAGRLFSRAVLGTSLKSREVQSLRRTARDILTFIPFAVILIAPITPVGHVLVFSFIQRYFPGFFPSQFTSRRQDLMIRYEDLKRQLEEAQEAAQVEDEEAELARATAAVARLTAPSAAAEAAMDAAEGLADAATARNGAPPRRKTRAAADARREEGPAAKALANLQKQVAAAAERTLTDMEEEK